MPTTTDTTASTTPTNSSTTTTTPTNTSTTATTLTTSPATTTTLSTITTAPGCGRCEKVRELLARWVDVDLSRVSSHPVDTSSMMTNVTRFLKAHDNGKFKAQLTDILMIAQATKKTKEQIDKKIRDAIAELTDGEHDHKEALYHYETVLAIRRYHVEELRMRILELGDYTNITAMTLFDENDGKYAFSECVDINDSLRTMLSELVSSGDVTDPEDVYSKIAIDCNAYAKRLIDSIYGECAAPIIPVLKN